MIRPLAGKAKCLDAEPVRVVAEQALVRRLHPKPVLMTLGQWGSFVAGAPFVLVLFFAPFDLGSYSVGGEVVSGPEFMRRAGWLFGLFGGLLLVIGVGLWRERPWVRPLMVLFWAALVLIAVTDPDIQRSGLAATIAEAVIAVATAGWYLYGKENVCAYFATRRDLASVVPAGRGRAER